MRYASILISLLLAALANACMWDRDTLAVEAKGHLDYVAAVIGRFERNPPLYYQMRLDRVREQLRHDPTQIDLYDDAGVAAARLGKFDEAIQWMARKRAAMKPLNMKDQISKEEWYRYYSNLGTFVSYDVFASIKTPAHLARLRQAISLLDKGLQINPKAHFGREKYQLYLLQWVVKVETEKEPPNLWDFLGGQAMPNEDAKALIRGYIGLIQLGAAWGSPDIFSLLRRANSYVGNAYLAQLADFREDELMKDGKKLLVAESGDSSFNRYEVWMPDDTQTHPNHAEYKRLRGEAEKQRANRDAFMLAKMKLGKHPDTDRDFWVGYSDPGPIEVRPISFFETEGGSIVLMVMPWFGSCCLVVLAPIAFFWIRARRRKLRQAA